MENDPGDVTRILHKLKLGDRAAQSELMELVYRELKKIARAHLRHESSTHSLQPTALVNEAYLRLVHVQERDWQGRSHFFAMSSKAMRQVLIDHARAANAAKRGGGEANLLFDEAIFASPGRAPEIIALDEALDELAKFDERQAQIVEMRYFAGMTDREIAVVLGKSTKTVQRDWEHARTWLFRQLSSQNSAGHEPI